MTTLDGIEKLYSWQDNWDSYGSVKPQQKYIEKATSIWSEILALLPEMPSAHVSATEEGEVVFEWWLNDKNNDKKSDTTKISLYIGEDLHYILTRNEHGKIRQLAETLSDISTFHFYWQEALK